MGGTTPNYAGRWDSKTYDTYRSNFQDKSLHQVFKQSGIHELMDPHNITLRESCDSDINPESTAIILGLDVTGSMGRMAHMLAVEGLGKLVTGILEHKPVTDPHIMVMGIGDSVHDRAPLQVSQFEPDIRIAEQLVNIYVEGGGGGNGWESYDLPWWFAANRTAIDCYTKRGKKGYLFTIGDEPPPPGVTVSNLNRIVGDNAECSNKAQGTLAAAQERYNVFHIILERVGYCSSNRYSVIPPWRKLLGARAILLSKPEHLTEVILAVMEVSEGADPETVLAKISDPDVRHVVRHALFD